MSRATESSLGDIRAEIGGARRELGKGFIGQEAPFQRVEQPHTTQALWWKVLGEKEEAN